MREREREERRVERENVCVCVCVLTRVEREGGKGGLRVHNRSSVKALQCALEVLQKRRVCVCVCEREREL